MPHINRIRLVNVKFNDAKGSYDDFMMRFDGKSATYDLVNSGGKSVLLLMLLQTVIPNTYLKSDRPLKNIFLGGNTKRTSHCLVEWILDEGSEYKYLLTGFCARKKVNNDEEVQTEEEKLDIEYYNYCYLYNKPNENDIKHLPLMEHINDENIVMSYDKLKQYLSNMKKEKMPVEYFSKKSEYLKYIEYFGLISAEWKLIAEINSSENNLEKYFKENKTSRKLIENFLIKIIDNINMRNSENNENEELSSALINIKDNLMKFKKESDNKQEYEQAKELFSHLEEKALSFEREYAEVEKLNKKAQEAYNFQKSKEINLKEKIENEKNQIEELGNKYRDLQIQNKKLEIDELNIEVDKLEDKDEIIENQIEQLKHKNSEISEKLRLSKAQNEYVEYKENKDNANQKKIQIDKMSLSESDVQKQYNMYGYNYKNLLEKSKVKLEKQLEVLNIEYQKLEKDKVIAEKQKDDANKNLAVISSNLERIEKELKDKNEEENGVIQELAADGLMDKLLDIENSILELEEQINQMQKQYNERKQHIENMSNEIIKNEKLEIEKKGKIEILGGNLDIKNNEYKEYESHKQEIERLIKIYNVQTIEELQFKLKMQRETKRQEKNKKEIKKQIKQRKLELIEKYKIAIPNEDIFSLKEKLIKKCDYVTTGVEELTKIETIEREKILKRNPWFVYAVFVDEASFNKIKKQGQDFETENLVPIANIEILREKEYQTKEENFIFPEQKELYKNLEPKNLEIYKQSLDETIKNLSQKILEDEAEENRIRNLLEKIEQFLNRYSESEVKNLNNLIETIKKQIQELNNQITEYRKLNQDYKDKINEENEIIIADEKNKTKLEGNIVWLKDLKKIKEEKKDLENKKRNFIKELESCKEIWEEKKEKYGEIERNIEELKNDKTSKGIECENISTILKDIGEFKETEILQEDFEQIKNQYEALNKKMSSSNSQLKELQESYNMYKTNMSKCEKIIQENNYTVEYFEHKEETVTKVLDTYIKELEQNLENVKKQEKEEKDLQEKNKLKIVEVQARIGLLIEQLEKEQYIYNKEERNKNLDEIHNIFNDNKQKMTIYKNKEKELSNKIGGIEKEIKKLESEINKLEIHLTQYNIEIEDIDLSNVLENEIYSYEKISENMKKITTEIQKQINNLNSFIKQMQEQVSGFYIESDIKEVISNIKIPSDKEESISLRNGVHTDIDLFEQKIEHIEKSLKSLAEYQDKFIIKCFEKAEMIVRDLNKLPGLSRIKIGGKDVNIIKLDLYEYEKDEKISRIRQYIENIVKEMESNPELMDKSKLNEKLSSKALVGQIVNIDKASVKLYKIEDILEHSTYKRWEDDLGSDGQVNAIYFMFAVCIISYISMLTRVDASSKSRKVIIADNPFGATSAVFLWDVMFSILKENNVQLIAPGHNISKEIVSKFEVNYILKHEYYNGNKKSVVVDKELRTESDEDNMSFEFLEGTQQSMF